MSKEPYCRICYNKHLTFMRDVDDYRKDRCDVCGVDISGEMVYLSNDQKIIDLENNKKMETEKPGNSKMIETHDYLYDPVSCKKIEINCDMVEIGREINYGIDLNDPHISRRQIRLEYKKRYHKVFIIDISRYNTTLINGIRMNKGDIGRQELHNNDEIVLYNKKLVYISNDKEDGV